MKLLRKVKTIEIKRTFALTPILRSLGIAKIRSSFIPSKSQYRKALKEAKTIVLNMKETELDKIVGQGYKRRLRSYVRAHWYESSVSTKEIGVWKGAGGLPKVWTEKSLYDTTRYVRNALTSKDKRLRQRARLSLPALITLKEIIKKEKYLRPIVFESGFGTNGRRGLTKMKGDIDDGSMRSIAFALSGDKELRVYIGLSNSSPHAQPDKK